MSQTIVTRTTQMPTVADQGLESRFDVRISASHRHVIGTLLPCKIARVGERVDCIDIFVTPNRFDAGKTQGQPAFVTRARLDGIESYFEHDVWFHLTITTTINNRGLFKMFGQL